MSEQAFEPGVDTIDDKSRAAASIRDAVRALDSALFYANRVLRSDDHIERLTAERLVSHISDARYFAATVRRDWEPYLTGQ